MKRIIMITIAVMLLVGISACTTNNKVSEPKDTTKPTTTTTAKPTQLPDENTDNDLPSIENIILSGEVADINGDMITLIKVKGEQFNQDVVLNISQDTKFFSDRELLEVGHIVVAEISPAMTRSIPPQSSAIHIESMGAPFVGKVIDVKDNSITVEPISDYFNHEQVIIHIAPETILDVDITGIKSGQTITASLQNMSTASIPPQVGTHRVWLIQD